MLKIYVNAFRHLGIFKLNWMGKGSMSIFHNIYLETEICMDHFPGKNPQLKLYSKNYVDEPNSLIWVIVESHFVDETNLYF